MRLYGNTEHKKYRFFVQFTKGFVSINIKATAFLSIIAKLNW